MYIGMYTYMHTYVYVYIEMYICRYIIYIKMFELFNTFKNKYTQRALLTRNLTC